MVVAPAAAAVAAAPMGRGLVVAVGAVLPAAVMRAIRVFTSALPALLGDRTAALRPHAFREDPPPVPGLACTAFMRTACGRYHLITGSTGFPASQHHELVAIELGHPGEVARTRRPMLLHDTALHHSFVKILQAFRAGSSMFAPILWQGEYLGVLICANAARGTFGESDLQALIGAANILAPLWVAHGGPGWIAGLDLTGLPTRSVGT